MTNRYMAMCLGCVECETPSYVIGFYTTKGQAQLAILTAGGNVRGRYTEDPCAHWEVYDVHGKVGFSEFQGVGK